MKEADSIENLGRAGPCGETTATTASAGSAPAKPPCTSSTGRGRDNPLAVLVALAVGCGSGNQVGSDNGRGDGSVADGTVNAADAETSTGGDGAGIGDAGVSDAVLTICGQCTLVPDAAPHTCALFQPDVVCDKDTDCTVCVWITCGCIDMVYGLNVASTMRCPPPPPCAVLPGDECSASGLETQNCQLVNHVTDVAVACVNHQCLTYPMVGSE